MNKIRPNEPDLQEFKRILLENEQVKDKPISVENVLGNTLTRAATNTSITLARDESGIFSKGINVSYKTFGDPKKDWDWIGVYLGSKLPTWNELDDYKTWEWVNQSEISGVKYVPVPNYSKDLVYTVVYFKWKWGVAAFGTV